jgi:hypothetical protein
VKGCVSTTSTEFSIEFPNRRKRNGAGLEKESVIQKNRGDWKLDSIVDREFSAIFDRTTEYVSLRNCLTREDIQNRMTYLAKTLLKAKHMSRTDAAKKRWGKKFKAVMTLRKEGFASRVIYEATMRPKSIYNLTLLFGKRKAKEIMLSTHKAKLRLLRKKEKEQIHHVHPR